MLGQKLIITVLDNRGFGCIDRLQRACGGASFNNLIGTVDHRASESWVDFAAHAASLGAISEKVAGIAELEQALARARNADRTYVVVIETDPAASTEQGGAWWDVAVPEVSDAPGSPRRARRLRESPRRLMVRLGTNPIAWSNDDLPELGGDTPLETCLREARAAGFTGIEKGNKFPTDPDRAARPPAAHSA